MFVCKQYKWFFEKNRISDILVSSMYHFLKNYQELTVIFCYEIIERQCIDLLLKIDRISNC